MKAKNQTDPAGSRAAGVVATLHEVTVTFDCFASRAVNTVNMQIKRGEVLGLVGPEQSGKSTILRLLANQLRPTAGKVKVSGRSMWRFGLGNQIGYLPQRWNHLRAAGLRSFLDSLSGLLKGRKSDGALIVM